MEPSPTARAAARRRRRTLLVVLAPLASVATLMLGLRVGAKSAVRAASVFVAPAGRPPAPGAPAPLAWQVLTYVEDRGVRETTALESITVIARRKGEESRWTGPTNEDGIAEASLALADLAEGDPVEVEVLARGEATPLASGVVRAPAGRAIGPDEGAGRAIGPDEGVASAAVRASRREGSIELDVLVEEGRLVVGDVSPLWVRVTPPREVDPSRVALHAEPEMGLGVEDATPKIGCSGWAELRASANGHAAGLAIAASDPSGRAGAWFGALPVAPGAFSIRAPRFVPANTPSTAELVAPNPRTVVYAEVNDVRGRVFAAALPLTTGPGDPVPRARLTLPPLAPGLHWLVVSGEPRGAERLAGAAIAKPFLVGGATGGGARIGGGAPHVRPDEACSVGPWLAAHPADGFPRRLELDGMDTRGASNRARRRVGLAIGVVSLLAAAALEVLLLTVASREARAALRRAEGDVLDTEPERSGAPVRARDGSVAVGLLVATLGFALLAALVIAKA